MEELRILDDIDLLTALVMGEAEGEPLLGKIAVAQVVKNRMEARRWPDDWKGVMLQRSQFSCFIPGYFRPEILKHSWSPAWKECKYAAFGVFHNYVQDVTKGANHYYNPDPRICPKTPRWARGKEPVIEIGQHLFFKL